MESKTDKKKTIIAFIALQIAILVYSFGGVCSKMAGRQRFLSLPFVFYYGLLLFILFLYAIVWQQVLKYLPLMVAGASKGIGLIYAMVWGALIFGEELKWNMILGCGIVLVGVYIFVFEDIKGE